MASPVRGPQGGAARIAKGSRLKPALSFNPSGVNDPQNREEINPDSAGSAVVRAQILLDRAHFSPGEIDGRWGDNLRVAIVGYQSARKLNPSGLIDPDTWQSLNADAAAVLVPHTISSDDEAGPFDRIPHAIMKMAKLKSLGYESPPEELGERFHINPTLLAQLNPGKALTKSGEQILVPNVQREYAVPADKIVVSKKTAELYQPTRRKGPFWRNILRPWAANTIHCQ
jgi:peptidoglycan hydrolase-like protein with peptidoglycan-binding domain